ncbi:MAG: hypothetical protein HY301_04515 [Verrucomicrobia bacterium]|nr:hypothetical protein [Verrucomicrobiota bacterium]
MLVALLLAGVLVWRAADHREPRPAGGAVVAVSNGVPSTVAPPAVLKPAATNPAVAAQPPMRPAPVPAAIRPIVADQLHFIERLAAVKKISGRELSPAEVKALLGFLLNKAPGTPGELMVEAAVKNEVLNRLVLGVRPLDGLTDVLIALHHDREQDAVMRDYAIQHLIVLHERLPAANSAEREKIELVLWEALAEKDSSIAGTALLGLHNLALGGAQLDTTRLGEDAVALARDESAGELARITALQVCAGRGLAEALPSATALAGGAPTVPLQISAIAALGRLGSARDLPALTELAGGTNARLQPAARTALATLRQRLASPDAPAPSRN